MHALRTLYFFQFLFSFGVGAATPILPLFARDLGADYTEVGLLGAAFGLASSVFAVLLGVLSDRFGRKAFIVIGSLVAVSAATGYLVAASVHHLLGLRFAEGLSIAAILPAADALTTNLAGAKGVGAALSWISTAHNVGFASGSFLGGSIADRLGLSAPFVVYLVAAVAAFSVALRLQDPNILHTKPLRPQASPHSGVHVWRNRHALRGCVTGGVHMFNQAIVITFLPVYARSLGLSISATGLLYSLFWVTRIAASLGSGSLSDRIGRNPVLVGAFLMAGTGFVVMGAGRSSWLLPATILVGLGLGAVFPVTIAMVSDHVPPTQRGLAIGIFEATAGLAFMVASGVGGLLAENVDPRAPYWSASVQSVVWAVIMAWRGRKSSLSI